MSRLPARASSRGSVRLVGKVQPRLFTPPLRPLNRRTSRGYEVIDFAEEIGVPLQPWQKWWLIHVLELLPDGTYRFKIVLTLVARQNGKSTVKRVLSLWRLYLDGARTILGIAQDVALAREQMGLCKATIFEDPDLYDEWGGDRKVNANEFFWLSDDSLPPGAPVEAHPRYLIRASNKKAGRGLSIDELNIDELREQTDWAAWSAVSKTVMARQYSQIHCLSNAGDETSVVLNQLRDSALAERDPSIGLFEWSGPEGCALDDLDAIRQANPGLGHVIQLPSILTALASDPVNVYRTEVLCQKVDTLEGPFDLAAWKRCGDQTIKSPAGRNVVACFDRSDEGHSTLAVALAEAGPVRVAIRKAWASDDDVRTELPQLLAELRPMVLAWYPSGPAAALATILRPKTKDGRLNPGRIKVIELVGGKAAEAVQGLAELLKAGGVVHNEDPLLDAHIRGAQKAPAGDGGFKIVRRGGGNVEAAYAAAGAVQVALTNPRRTLSMKVVS